MKVNSFRPRYAKISLVSLPKVVKPAIHDEVMCKSNHGNDRGGWKERASKDQKGKPKETR